MKLGRAWYPDFLCFIGDVRKLKKYSQQHNPQRSVLLTDIHFQDYLYHLIVVPNCLHIAIVVHHCGEADRGCSLVYLEVPYRRVELGYKPPLQSQWYPWTCICSTVLQAISSLHQLSVYACLIPFYDIYGDSNDIILLWVKHRINFAGPICPE